MSPAFHFKREGPQSLCVSSPTRNRAHSTEHGVTLKEVQDGSGKSSLSVDRRLFPIMELVHCLALGGSLYTSIHLIIP